jgi:hypothetical protein
MGRVLGVSYEKMHNQSSGLEVKQLSPDARWGTAAKEVLAFETDDGCPNRHRRGSVAYLAENREASSRQIRDLCSQALV